MNKLTEGSNMRWESMRMILPEQREALKRMEIEDSKVPQPVLDEYELQEIGKSIQDAQKDHKLIEITYWKDGFIKKMTGNVAKIDAVYKRLKMNDTFGISWQYDFKDIVGVQISDDV